MTQHDDMQYDTVTIAEEEDEEEGETTVDHKDGVTAPLPAFTTGTGGGGGLHNLKDWQFDFEPIDVDFMLQESSNTSS